MDEVSRQMKHGQSTVTPSEDESVDMPGKMKVRVVLRQDQADGGLGGNTAAPLNENAARSAVKDPEKVLYDYRIDRILLAMLGLLLVLGGLAFLGYQFLGADQLPDQASDQAAPQAVEGVIGSETVARRIAPPVERAPEVERTPEEVARPLRRNAPESSADRDTIEIVLPKVDGSAPAVARNGAEPIAQDPQLLEPKTSRANVERSTVDAPVLPQTGLAEAQSVNASQSAQAEVTVARVQTPSAGVASSAPRIVTFNDAVVRASLNWRVVDLEPGRTVAQSPIVFEAGEAIKRVFFYTQLDGKKDNIYFYEWFLEGRSEAKVKVGVWSNRWRSYSSKQILRKQVGNWRVTLSDDAGNIYASAAFVVQ